MKNDKLLASHEYLDVILRFFNRIINYVHYWILERSSCSVARERKFSSLRLITPSNIPRYCHLLFALPLCIITAIVPSARAFSCKYITTRSYLQKRLYRCSQSRPRHRDSIEIGQARVSLLAVHFPQQHLRSELCSLKSRLSVQPPPISFPFNALLITRLQSDANHRANRLIESNVEQSGFGWPTPAGESAVTHSFPTATSIHHHRAIMRLRYDHRQVYGHHLRTINRPRIYPAGGHTRGAHPHA